MGQERIEAFIHVKLKVDKQKEFHESKGNHIESRALGSVSGMIQNLITEERGDQPKPKLVKPHVPRFYTR